MAKKMNMASIGSCLMLIAAAIIMAVKPFAANLDSNAHMILGGIIITLGIWIFKPFNLSFSAGGMFLAFISLAFGLRPTAVFSGFTQNAIWTLIPALFFGFTLQKTGLGKRIAIGIIKLFKPSYTSLIISLVLIGVALSLLTPSSTVRIAIMLPIAVQFAEIYKLEIGSKGNSLVILTAFSMAILPGSAWMTGVLWGPIISGMINAVPGTLDLVNFGNWFGVMFVPVMLTTIILLAASIIIFKPKVNLTQETIDGIKAETVPALTKAEIIAGVILVAVFIMFLTNNFHGLPDAAICLAAVFLFFATGVLETKDFNTGVNWDLIVFVAIALSLSAILGETGISSWLAGIAVPALEPIAGNPFLFMFSVMGFAFLWRFFDVALFIPTMAILVPILPAIQEAYNINPLVWLYIFVMGGNSFVMAYQNMWAMMSRAIAGERSFTNKHIGLYGLIYIAACLITLIAAIPMWASAGYFR